MQADAILSKKLFRPNLKTGEGRESLAAQEATRAKSCLGALRYLWRNSKDAAHHPKVAELKTYVRLSPTQQHRLDNPGADDANFPAAIRDASEVGSGGDESDGTGHEGGGDSSSDFDDDEETLELGGGDSEGDHREDIQPASTQEDDNGSNDGGSDSDDHEDGSKVIVRRESTPMTQMNSRTCRLVPIGLAHATVTKRLTAMTMMIPPALTKHMMLIPAMMGMIMMVISRELPWLIWKNYEPVG